MPGDLSLDQLLVFETIAREGGFSRAGRALGRSQAAVTYAIKALEAQLGLALFDRSGYRASLTPEGESLLESTRRLLREEAALTRRARELQRGPGGELHLGISCLLPDDALWSALSVVCARFHGLRLSVHRGPGTEPVDAVAEGRVELAVSPGDPTKLADEGYEVQPLLSVPQSIIAAPDHSLVMEESTVMASALSAWPELVLVAPGARPSLVEGDGDALRHGFNDLSLLLEGVRRGFGWSLLPSWMLEELGPAHGLVSISPHEAPVPAAALFIARRSDHPPSDPAGCFWDLMLGRT